MRVKNGDEVEVDRAGNEVLLTSIYYGGLEGVCVTLTPGQAMRLAKMLVGWAWTKKAARPVE